jgi:hypothetical protein
MLRVPLYGQAADGSMSETDKYLELATEDLPDDVNKLVYLLQREKVPIGFWLKIAVINCST